jgi:hypothetical protein
MRGTGVTCERGVGCAGYSLDVVRGPRVMRRRCKALSATHIHKIKAGCMRARGRRGGEAEAEKERKQRHVPA